MPREPWVVRRVYDGGVLFVRFADGETGRAPILDRESARELMVDLAQALGVASPAAPVGEPEPADWDSAMSEAAAAMGSKPAVKPCLPWQALMQVRGRQEWRLHKRAVDALGQVYGHVFRIPNEMWQALSAQREVLQRTYGKPGWDDRPGETEGRGREDLA